MQVSTFISNVISAGQNILSSPSRYVHVGDPVAILCPSTLSLPTYIQYPATTAAYTEAYSVLSPVAGGATSLGPTTQINLGVQLLRYNDMQNLVLCANAAQALQNASTPSTLATAVVNYIANIVNTVPNQAISTLLQLSTAITYDGGMLATMYYSNILVALAGAILQYTPTSQQDTENLIVEFMSLYTTTSQGASNLATTTGNFSWFNVVTALNNLRANVLTYLQQKIASEPTVLTMQLGDSLPAVVLAYMIYNDVSREQDLINLNAPCDAMAMPLTLLYYSN